MTARAADSDRRNEVIGVVVLTVAAVVLLYARAPFAVQKLWAEDGRDFLGDAIRLGPIRSLGQDRQGGYYILGSRMGGVLAAMLPLQMAAVTVWLWVASITAWIVATVAVSSRAWLRTWPSRIAIALAVVLVPVLGVESIANAANLQVTLMFVSVIVLISQPRSRVETVNACAILVATALTTTLAATLVPFAVYRLFRTRRFGWDALSVSWAAGVALQWLAIAIGRPPPAARDGAGLSSIVSRLWTAGLRDNLQPFDLPNALAPVVVLGFCALLGAAIWLAWRDRQHLRAAWMVAVPAFGVGLFVVTAAVSGAQSRYMVTPALCLIWSVLAASETLADRVAARGRLSPTMIMAAVAAVLLVAWLPRWAPSEERRSGPTWDDGIALARAECEGQPPDTPVRIQIAPVREDTRGQWIVPMTCRDL